MRVGLLPEKLVICWKPGPKPGQRAVLDDDDEMVVDSYPEKQPEPPLGGLFQRLAYLCAGHRGNMKDLEAAPLTPLQQAESKLERLTGINLKAVAYKERSMGTFRYNFGTSFLVGNWLVSTRSEMAWHTALGVHTAPAHASCRDRIRSKERARRPRDLRRCC